MKYVTAIERMAEARGVLLTTRLLISRQLIRRFGAVPATLIEKIDELSIAQLDSLGEASFDFETIDDLTAWLENSPM